MGSSGVILVDACVCMCGLCGGCAGGGGREEGKEGGGGAVNSIFQ